MALPYIPAWPALMLVNSCVLHFCYAPASPFTMTRIEARHQLLMGLSFVLWQDYV